jgi:hypothetical protein
MIIKRYSLCGAVGTGKSSLVNKIAENFGKEECQYITYSRPTAAARSMGYNSAREIPDYLQWEFQTKCLTEQLSAQDKVKGSCIFDRCTLDNIAFLHWKLPWLRFTDEFELYESICVNSALNYFDKIVYVPHFSLEPEENGVRLMVDSRPIEAELTKLFKKYQIPNYELKTVGLKNRYQELMEILNL